MLPWIGSMQISFGNGLFDSLRLKSASGKVPVAIAIQEIPDLALGFFFRHGMPPLDAAGKLVAPARVHARFIVGKPAPLFFEFPAELLQVAFDSIPVHVRLPVLPDWVCVHRVCVHRDYSDDRRQYRAYHTTSVPAAGGGVCALGYISGDAPAERVATAVRPNPAYVG